MSLVRRLAALSRRSRKASTPPAMLQAQGRTWALEQHTLIGRRDEDARVDPEVDLTDLDPDRSISRRHASVERDRGVDWIEDLGSANGTTVNGRRLGLGQRHPLRDGSVVGVGDVELVYRDDCYAQSLASRTREPRDRPDALAPESDIFISYAQDEDAAPALQLADELRNANATVWIAVDNIDGGQNYGPEVVAAIEGCKVFVVLASKSSLRSKHVATEIKLAFEADRPLLPLRLDDTSYPDDVRYWLTGSNWIDIWGPKNQWLAKVLHALRSYGVECGGVDPRPGSS